MVKTILKTASPFIKTIFAVAFVLNCLFAAVCTGLAFAAAHLVNSALAAIVVAPAWVMSMISGAPLVAFPVAMIYGAFVGTPVVSVLTLSVIALAAVYHWIQNRKSKHHR